MFKVYYKKDTKCDNPIIVYRIRDDKNGFPHFLIYKNREWKYKSAKYFKVYDDEFTHEQYSILEEAEEYENDLATIGEMIDDCREEKDCSTCANNVEYPPPHTCDICTSLDQEEEYGMWKLK